MLSHVLALTTWSCNSAAYMCTSSDVQATLPQIDNNLYPNSA